MLEVSTQTYRHLVARQRKAMIMRSRMEMLLREGSLDRNHAEVSMLELIESAMSRTSARVVRSFLNYTTKWNEAISFAGFRISDPTLTGAFDWISQNTLHIPILCSAAEPWMEEMIGYDSLEWDVENHS